MPSAWFETVAAIVMGRPRLDERFHPADEGTQRRSGPVVRLAKDLRARSVSRRVDPPSPRAYDERGLPARRSATRPLEKALAGASDEPPRCSSGRCLRPLRGIVADPCIC